MACAVWFEHGTIPKPCRPSHPICQRRWRRVSTSRHGSGTARGGQALIGGGVLARVADGIGEVHRRTLAAQPAGEGVVAVGSFLGCREASERKLLTLMRDPGD